MTELQTAILSRLDALAAQHGVPRPKLFSLSFREQWQLAHQFAPALKAPAKLIHQAIVELSQHHSV